jgi:TatD DNase family protein
MRLVDTHAHLDDRAFDRDRPALVARLHADDVGVVTVGADVASSRAAVRLAERHRLVWATVGVHPHGAKWLTPDVLRELEELAGSARVVAVGEIGLDYYRDLSPRDLQRRAFGEQLALAKRLDLPLVLHNRESTDDFVAILRDHAKSHRGVVHSFLGDAALAATFLRLGLHLGVGGPLTYPANAPLREAVRTAPLERLVLETDCPYLTPVPHRGERNEPAYIALVAAEIARLRAMSIDDVGRATTENARALFGLA